MFVIVLLASQNLCSFGKQIPPSRFIRSSNIKISHHLQLPENEKQSTATQKRVVRQADDFSTMLSLVQYGMKYLPTLIKLFNSFTGGSEGAGSGIGGGGGGLLDIAAGLLGGGTKVESSSGVDPATVTNKVDKIEDKIDLVKDEPFSWENLISKGIKVALAIFYSYTTDGIDRIDNISPTQAILGTILGALTGSENPNEVAIMAKQATAVISTLFTLFEAIGTSISS